MSCPTWWRPTWGSQLCPTSSFQNSIPHRCFFYFLFNETQKSFGSNKLAHAYNLSQAQCKTSSIDFIFKKIESQSCVRNIAPKYKSLPHNILHLNKPDSSIWRNVWDFSEIVTEIHNCRPGVCWAASPWACTTWSSWSPRRSCPTSRPSWVTTPSSGSSPQLPSVWSSSPATTSRRPRTETSHRYDT